MRVGCQGFCQMGPLVTILPEGNSLHKVKVEDVAEIIAKTLSGARWSIDCSTWIRRPRNIAGAPTTFRSTSASSGLCCRNAAPIDPENIHEYVHHGGYAAARKAFLQHDARAGLPGDYASPACAAAAAADSRPAANGKPPARRRAPRNTSFATPTKATRARS